MNKCVRCDGTGVESYYEDDCYQQHDCYHCSATGVVDSETAFHDRLMEVAHTLAYNHVSEMRDNRNSDPDGEGWDFCAAENMMSGRDYFDMHVYDYTQMYAQQLNNLSEESQELLIAWHKMPHDRVQVKVTEIEPQSMISPFNMEVWAGEDDNLPF